MRGIVAADLDRNGTQDLAITTFIERMGIADKAKIEAAIKMLQEQGHSVQTQMRGEKNTVWFEIDRRMLAS